jgi:hypothetical protein
MCLFNSAEYVNLEQTEHLYTLKTRIHRNYSFEKLTQFAQGNNMLDARALTHKVFFREIPVFLQVS